MEVGHWLQRSWAHILMVTREETGTETLVYVMRGIGIENSPTLEPKKNYLKWQRYEGRDQRNEHQTTKPLTSPGWRKKRLSLFLICVQPYMPSLSYSSRKREGLQLPAPPGVLSECASTLFQLSSSASTLSDHGLCSTYTMGQILLCSHKQPGHIYQLILFVFLALLTMIFMLKQNAHSRCLR